MVLAQNRHMDQEAMIKDPERNLVIDGQLIFNKGVKNIYWREQYVQQMICNK
jgi:hypothetical protein